MIVSRLRDGLWFGENYRIETMRLRHQAMQIVKNTVAKQVARAKRQHI